MWPVPSHPGEGHLLSVKRHKQSKTGSHSSSTEKRVLYKTYKPLTPKLSWFIFSLAEILTVEETGANDNIFVLTANLSVYSTLPNTYADPSSLIIHKPMM